MKLSQKDNVVFIRNGRSNVIKEAFVVLKDNINLKNIVIDADDVNKIDLLKEAEQIINNAVEVEEISFNGYMKNKLEKKLFKYKLLSFLLLMLVFKLLI